MAIGWWNHFLPSQIENAEQTIHWQTLIAQLITRAGQLPVAADRPAAGQGTGAVRLLLYEAGLEDMTSVGLPHGCRRIQRVAVGIVGFGPWPFDE